MFKRVLLCYDGTEAGRRALRRGAELAMLLGAQVYVLSDRHRRRRQSGGAGGRRRPGLHRR